jgi:hypothetical protein
LSDIDSLDSSSLKGKKVLIVDDVKDNQMLESFYVRKAGCEVELASNGSEAVEKALHGDHDAILMDLHMPILDGISATVQLRDQGYLKPIIAVTADTQSNVRNRAYQVGFDDFISKPLRRSELLHALAKFIFGNCKPSLP